MVHQAGQHPFLLMVSVLLWIAQAGSGCFLKLGLSKALLPNVEKYEDRYWCLSDLLTDARKEDELRRVSALLRMLLDLGRHVGGKGQRTFDLSYFMKQVITYRVRCTNVILGKINSDIKFSVKAVTPNV